MISTFLAVTIASLPIIILDLYHLPPPSSTPTYLDCLSVNSGISHLVNISNELTLLSGIVPPPVRLSQAI